MDSVNAMIVFARVVEANGFSAAARRLGLSKSAVSKQVAALEDRLGARLLNRTTRRISPTEIGQALFERCQRIAAEVEEAELAVTRLSTAPRGRLRVNASMSFGHIFLAPVLPDFHARYPEVTVEMTLNDRIVDVVEEGYDLAIRIARLDDSSLIARKLADAQRILAASPAYLARAGRPERAADLAQHDCLTYSYAARPGVWRVADADGAVREVPVSGSLHTNNGDALRAAALAGLGIVELPTFLIGDDVAAGRLVHVFPHFVDRFGGIYAVYPHNRHLSAKVRALVDFLVARIGPKPPWDCAFLTGGACDQ